MSESKPPSRASSVTMSLESKSHPATKPLDSAQARPEIVSKTLGGDIEKQIDTAEESALPEDKLQEAREISEDEKLHDGWETDSANPRNWSFAKKWTASAIVSMYTLVGPLGSSMMAPGLPDLAKHYEITNSTIVALTLSIFLLSFALGPLIWAPLSEMYGRTWPLHIGNMGTVAFTLGCAFSPNTETLIIMRLFVGLFSSAPIAIGAGSISDIFAAHERASAMSLYALGPLLGPAIGPLIGGYITQYLGLKYLFIILAGICGSVSVFGIPLLRETYAPVIRLRKAKKAGNEQAFLESHPEFAAAHQSKIHMLWTNLSRPTVMLCQSGILFTLALYMAFVYGIFYLMFATFAALFKTIYGFKTGVGGLVYLGLGVGSLLSTGISAKVSDVVYRKMKERNGGVSEPEHRLPLLFVGAAMLPVGLLWYGWSADQQVHWIMPIIGSAIFAFAQMTIFVPISLYLVDAFQFAASATSAAAVFRSLFGFAFPLFAQQMFDSLGLGPGNSLLAGISVVLGIPVPLYIFFKGAEWRKKSKYTR